MIHYAKVNDITMRYISFGSGPIPFIILPGISVTYVTPAEEGLKAAFADFCEDFTIYLFDRKEAMPADYSVEQMTADTVAVMQSLGIKNACVYGASQGGMIALEMAAVYPEVVQKIVLASASAHFGEVGCNAIRYFIDLARNDSVDALAKGFAEKLLGEKKRETMAPLMIAGLLNATDAEIERFIIEAEGCITFDFTEKIDQVHCPVLLIGSAGDQIIPMEEMEALATAVNAETLFFAREEGYGHAVYDEAPDVIGKMLTFCRK